MVATEKLQASVSPEEIDQRVFLRGVRWADYEALLERRGESSIPRLTYLEGVLELMNPSRNHEQIKKTIARLIEAYADEIGIAITGVGSLTIRDPEVDRGAEPDECYCLGDEGRDVPDFAIEVVWTRGGIDKLEVYRKLRVPEVWIWKKGEISVHALSNETYAPVERSAFLPDIDLAKIAALATHRSQPGAVRELRAFLRGDRR